MSREAERKATMYFYPRHISQNAVDALASVGLTFSGNELFIPENEYTSESDAAFSAKGVRLVRRLITFSGHAEAPKTYSTLHGDMVPSGVDLNQCRICGYWMSRKMTYSDEEQHNRLCRPQYEWILA